MSTSVLITGRTSVLGQACYAHLKNAGYRVQSMSLRTDNWKNESFESYHHLLHVAGIAHVSYQQQDASIYDTVNHQLTIEVAKKAKLDGVKQFIFFSTMLVLGESTKKNQPFTLSSPPNPQNPYSLSKHHAEEALLKLADEDFMVTILRLPFVYGPKAKGNYGKLSRLALKLPFFVKTTNQRSMLYIGHLTHWVEAVIQHPFTGFVYPQNDDLVSTSDLFKTIRAVHGKNTWLIPGLGWGFRFISPIHPVLRKLFASLAYAEETKQPLHVKDVVSFETSIKESEATNHE